VIDRTPLFRRRANRFVAWFRGYGPIPVAEALDDEPRFASEKPSRIGDDAIIEVEGQRRRVRLLPSMEPHSSLFLVDLGPA
jgi:hypothetical protein